MSLVNPVLILMMTFIKVIHMNFEIKETTEGIFS